MEVVTKSLPHLRHMTEFSIFAIKDIITQSDVNEIERFVQSDVSEIERFV